MLKWVLERSEGRGEAIDTPIGYTPAKNGLDLRGLDLSDEALATLLKVDPFEWAEAVQSQEAFFESFGSRLPRGIREEHEVLAHRIQDTTTPADLRGWESGI